MGRTPKKVTPYGAWVSPISATLVASGGVRLEVVTVDGDDIYWIEGRPNEGGRNVIVVYRDERASDAIPAQFNARTRVYEYGGGSYIVNRGVLYFSNFADQQVYRSAPGEQPEPITPPDGMRFADYSFDVARNRLICIREDRTTGSRFIPSWLLTRVETLTAVEYS